MKYYDFALSWNSGLKEEFVRCIKTECKFKKLSLLIVTESNVSNIISKLESSKIKIGFLLDNESDYCDKENKFARLSYAVKDCNGYILCDPDDAKQASNKAITHYDLAHAGINVPYTVVVRNWEPENFCLTKGELKRLRMPFIVKPANGFGQKGVVKDCRGSFSEILQARNYSRGDDFLLQKRINPIIIGDKKAWFRVYYLFGEIIPCWWDTDSGAYSHMTLNELNINGFLPLAEITSRIAKITNMEFFTTEIAVTGTNREKLFYAIDYVNDQPELCIRNGKSEYGPVLGVVKHISERIVDIAWRKKYGFGISTSMSIFLNN